MNNIDYERVKNKIMSYAKACIAHNQGVYPYRITKNDMNILLDHIDPLRKKGELKNFYGIDLRVIDE